MFYKLETLMRHPFFLKQRKKQLYRIRGGCAYGGCTVTDIKLLTIDHITGIAHARSMGWSWGKIHDIRNLQLLCRYHHDIKDYGQPRGHYESNRTTDKKFS